jgi:hypothetical protein
VRINEIVYVIFGESSKKNYKGIIKNIIDGKAIVKNYDKYYDCWETNQVSKNNIRKIN